MSIDRKPGQPTNSKKALEMRERINKPPKIKRSKYSTAGKSTGKQIALLQHKGFKDVKTWSFEKAHKYINQIQMNGWELTEKMKNEIKKHS